MASSSKKIRWLPSESNPDVINKFVQALGVPGDKWQFCDVFGTDPELLQMIPKPVTAVLLLFPITDVSEQADAKEEEKITKEGQIVSTKVWFMKQTIGNACGTIGVLHSLANMQDRLGLSSDSPLAKFFTKTNGMDPALKASTLEGEETLAEVHEENAKEGQTQAPQIDNDTNLHFIAFLEKDGHLYELDGRKPFPINHGKTSPETLLEDSVKVIQQFIKRDPDEVNFSLLALTAAV